MLISRVATIFIFSLFFIGCASTSDNMKVSGLDDPLEDKVEFSTYSYDSPFLGIVNPWDSYFRGYFEKSSGSKIYQLYIVTNSPDWRGWNEARFIINGELKKVPVTAAGSDVKCSQYGCAHFEDSIIYLDKAVLDYWSSKSKEITVRLISSRTTDTVDIKFDPKESLFFLNGLDKF